MGSSKKITILSIIFVLVFYAGIKPVFSYSIDTHAYLTKEIIDLYNKNYKSNTIENNIIPYLIDGSRREDDAPRFMNHFYDPINGSGLHHDGAIDPMYHLGTWNSAKLWAQNDAEQNKIKYSPLIDTILTSIAKAKIQKFLPTSDFTYNQALKYWISGDKEMAMFTLGHILHLIEDISVPAHTRNDPHGEGDPYESWTQQFTLNNPSEDLKNNILNKKPIELKSLNNYFGSLSKYTNNNFYSKDTIGIQSGYKNPTPDYEEKDNQFIVGIEKTNNEIIKLYIKNKTSPFSIVGTNNNMSLFVDDENGGVVLQNNWKLLSTKDVQYGAGVIKLFFQDVEKHKNDPEYTIKGKETFFGKIIGSIGNIFNSIFGKSNYTPVGEIQTNGGNSEQPSKNKPEQPQQNQNPNTQQQQPKKKMTVTENKNQLHKVIRIVDGDTIILDNGDIIRYTGIDTPELSPKQCYGEEATKENKKLVLGKYIRLEKTEQDQDDYGRLVRYVWLNDTLINESLLKNGSARAYTFGHPHPKEQEFTSIQNKAKNAKRGMWGDICNKKEQETSTSTKKEPSKRGTHLACKFNTSQSPSNTTVIINEIAWMGSTNSSSDEWVELYNTTSETIDISNWTLTDKNEQIKVTFGSKNEKVLLPTHSYYLLERTDDSSVPNITADAIYKGSLSNSNEGLRLFNSHCQLMDEAIADPSWQAGISSSRRTMERNSSGFGWHNSSQINGTPKNQNSAPYYENSDGGNTGGGSSTNDAPPNDDDDQNSAPQYANVIINEIMYNLDGTDSEREWIEILNNATNTVDLSDWTIYENGTQHNLTPTQGDNLLSAGEFAILADNSQTFLTDWTNYNGTIFDSTFSLNNASETIALYNSSLEIDSYSYENTTGGDGNGNTIGLINNIWQETSPTPGEINQIAQINSTTTATTTPPSTPASSVSHLLISEVQTGGQEADDEFVELYNPTNNPISLDGYSIQYISGQATSTNNVYKKNFESLTIPAMSFFLLAQNNSKYASTSDIAYGFSLSGITNGGHIALVSSTTPMANFSNIAIVDSISYGSTTMSFFPHTPIPPANKSIERMAIYNGFCVTATGDTEYAGNGCDRDGDDDFYIRDNPTPQNLLSFSEPRTAPLPPQNFTSIYSSSSLSVDFAWSASTSTNSSSTATIYKITNADNQEVIATTTMLQAHTRIYEVGKQYSFNLSICDDDGLCSQSETATIDVPSFLDGLYAYQDPNEQSSSTLIEATYSQYPFIPNTYQQGDMWKMIVFYLNSEAETQQDIYQTWQPDDLINVMPIKYIHCSGGSNSQENTLILPDNSGFCGTPGGAYNRAMESDKIGEHSLSIHASPDEHANYDSQNPQDNYITVAFYSTQSTMPSDGRIPYFGLVATDATHYQIGTQPTHQSPIMTGNITSLFNLQSSEISLSWQPATDYDTLPNLISYSIQTTASSSWIGTGQSINTTIPVSPGDVLSISIKATDEFGNESNMIGPLQWSYPQTTYIINQTDKDSFSNDFGGVDGMGAKSAMAQKIIFDSNSSFNIIETILEHYHGSHEATVRLSLYTEINGKPDMTNEIAHADSRGLATAGESPMNFYFTNPVTLNKNTPYWLVMKIQNYSAQSGWHENSWRVPISTQNSYLNGDYAKINIETSGALNGFSIQPDKDWYMKLEKVE